MATIFDREFRREKNLEQAKRQAEMKKPVKKDNTIMDKKAEKMQNYLNDLEEQFFKHVAEDQDQLATIKQRGAHLDGHEEQKKPVAAAPKQAEPVKQPEPVKQQQQQQQQQPEPQPAAHHPPAAVVQNPPPKTPSEHEKSQHNAPGPSLTLGNHLLHGTYTKADGTSHELKVHLSVEEGGIIQLSEGDQSKHGYSVNGFLDEKTISFKIMFADQREVEINGFFDEANKVITGEYKSNPDHQFDAEGSVRLEVKA